MPESNSDSPPKRNWFTFSLRTLLLLMLLVAVYFAGFNAFRMQQIVVPRLGGTWEMHLPAGFKRPVTLSRVGNKQFVLGTGGVLGGTYEWRNGQLVVVKPTDKRMTGLIWNWDGQRLNLIAEPAGAPTGSSYLGASLERKQDDQAP